MPPALKRLLAAGAILRPFPQEVLEACYNAANGIYADLSKTNPHFAKMYTSPGRVPCRIGGVDAGGRIGLRQLHDADAHPHLRCSTQTNRIADKRSPGDLSGASSLTGNFHFSTRFLRANQCPLRLKTLAGYSSPSPSTSASLS